MGPFPVVIGAPHLQQASQVAFTQRDRPVKTLAPQGANQSLTKRICFRAAVRCFQHSKPQVGDRGIERLSIDTVAVMNEQPIRMVGGDRLAQAAVGFEVTFQWRRRREACSMITKMYRTRKLAVTATQKSQATMAAA